MTQQTTQHTDVYPTVLDFTDDTANRIIQGQTRYIDVEFGDSPLEPTDVFSLPLFSAWGDKEAYVTLSGKVFFKVVGTTLRILFPGDKTSLWSLSGALEYGVRTLTGALNHHDKDGVERAHSGKVLLIAEFVHSWDRS